MITLADCTLILTYAHTCTVPQESGRPGEVLRLVRRSIRAETEERERGEKNMTQNMSVLGETESPANTSF